MNFRTGKKRTDAMEDTEDTKAAQWFVFYGDRLLMRKKPDGTCTVPTGNSLPVAPTDGQHVHRVTLPSGKQVYTFSASHPLAETDGWMTAGLRASFDYLPPDEYKAAGKARQILYWDEHSRYCPVCGTPTEPQTDIMKKCPRCGNEIYPPVATAIIVLVRRGEEILMVHARNFRGTFYGLVAGFLEAGETLEQCVRREVKEETGLSVSNITYFDSQPWPYPSGLMVGFFADYESGEIRLQADELSAGAFYRRDNLPELPHKLSIARRLIDTWLAGKDRT